MSVRASLMGVVVAAVVASPSAGRAAPPRGLTERGRLLWNLEAMLHDTFGSRGVYLQTWGDYPPPWGKSKHRAWNFSVVSLSNCCSGYWLFTFGDARHSAFQAVRLKEGPQPKLGASGGEMPLTIRGAYIACGKGRWLYAHAGNGPANFQLDCSASE